jgi:hypothetical protein
LENATEGIAEWKVKKKEYGNGRQSEETNYKSH